MTIEYFIGLAVSFILGVVCRLLDLPVPAPPTLYAALMVCSITVGYFLASLI